MENLEISVRINEYVGDTEDIVSAIPTTTSGLTAFFALILTREDRIKYFCQSANFNLQGCKIGRKEEMMSKLICKVDHLVMALGEIGGGGGSLRFF